MLVIRAERVFDGESLTDARDVVVDDRGRIAEVRPAGDVPDRVELVDHGPGTTLLPGLIDGHQHLSWGCTIDVLDGIPEGREAQLDLARANARRALAGGVTTIQDLGDDDYAVLTLRERAAGDTALPRLLASGPPITSPGGHCHFLGGSETRAQDVVAAVEERADRGVDVIKVMASGGNITPGSLPWESQYDVTALRELVAAAHRRGLRVALHGHGTAAVLDGAAAGADCIEHVSLMTSEGTDEDEAVLRALVAAGAWLRITPGVAPGGPPPPPAILARMPGALANLRRAHALGARIVVSTDAGISPGKPHDRLVDSVHAFAAVTGDPVGALQAVTSRAADAVGLGSVTGRLRRGLAADVLVVRGDPTRDVADLVEVAAVHRDGIAVAGSSTRPRPVAPGRPPEQPGPS